MQTLPLEFSQQLPWSELQENIFAEFARSNSFDNVVIEARAGTGKTTTIVEGILRAPEEKIVLCAFGKDIQLELAKRIKRNPRAVAMTLHALGYRCVQNFWEKIRVNKPMDEPARGWALTEKVCGTIIPDAIKRLVTKLHTLARETAPHANHPDELIDLAIRFQCEPDELWHRNGYGLEYIAHRAIEAMRLAASDRDLAFATGIDYSDMIFLPVRNGWLLKEYDLVVVDEAQDMTLAQLEIAVGICRGRIIIVGDPRQAIFAFRGADSHSMARLTRELQAKVLPLNITYRCGTDIVDLAKKLVPDYEAGPNNPKGAVLDLATEGLVKAAEHGDFILSRLNAPLVPLAISLLRSKKRARIAGRDIGKGLQTLVNRLSKTSHNIEVFLEKLTVWQEREVAKWTAAKRPDRVEGVADQAMMIRELCDGALSTDELAERIEFLFTDKSEEGTIRLSSIHRAKGKEANRVFMLVDTLYLRGVTTEEENLNYVAITRAKLTYVRVSSGIKSKNE